MRYVRLPTARAKSRAHESAQSTGRPETDHPSRTNAARLPRDGAYLQEVGVMPKETIAMNEPLTSDSWAPAWSLTVGWSADPSGQVQVGATITGDHQSGQFFTLHRAQINNLIRTLRRARDASYGADA